MMKLNDNIDNTNTYVHIEFQSSFPNAVCCVCLVSINKVQHWEKRVRKTNAAAAISC